MPVIPPSTSGLRSTADSGARVATGASKPIRRSGLGQADDVFARTWDTPTSAEVDSHKQNSRTFAQGQREAYDEKTADAGSRELKGRLKDARPLASHHFERLHSHAMMGRTEAAGRHALDRTFEDSIASMRFTPQGNPRMAARSVATHVVDRLLGFNLVPDTQLATADGKAGIVIDFAPLGHAAARQKRDVHDEALGVALLHISSSDPEAFQDALASADCKFEDGRVVQLSDFGAQELNPDDPGMRRALAKLDVLDALTANTGRHPGNCVIERNDQGAVVQLHAVDNGHAFGPEPAPLPPLVDTQMKSAIHAISPDNLRQELAGLLTKDEVDATVVRLDKLKTHIDELEKTGNVIDPADWDSPEARS